MEQEQFVQDGTGSTITEENHSYHSFKRVPMPGTPFTKMYQEDKGWYLVMGDYRLTNEEESEEALDEFVKDNMWNIMVVMMDIVAVKNIELAKEKQ